MGSSIDVLHEALKIAHTYTFFDEKFLWIRDSFRIMILWIFPIFYMRIMQSENFATNIHTHYRQSETAPHIRALYARKFRPQIYIRIAVRLESVWAIDWRWHLGVRLYHVFIYVVVVWIRSFLLIGWCQNLIIKAWWDCINSL